jgi:hypothetical protein
MAAYLSSSFRRRVAATVERFRRDRSGAVAVLFGITALALVMMVGAAVDYSRLNNKSTEMLNACDAALLAAMRQMQIDGPPLGTGGSSGSGSTGNGTAPSNKPKKLNGSATVPYEDLANKAFLANLRQDAGALRPSFSLTLTAQNDEVVGVGHFSADVPLVFGGLFGMQTAQIAKDCQTQIGQAPRIDFHFLADTSMSMGLAANVADRTRMMAGTLADLRISDLDRDARAQPDGSFTGRGCAFACHTARPNFDGTLPKVHISTLQWARENGIKLRIDVEKDGLNSFIQTMEASKPTDGSFRYSLGTFNALYANVRDLTDTVATIKGDIAQLTLGYPNATNPFDFNATLPDASGNFNTFGAKVQAHLRSPDGQGYRQFIILVTDGVRSVPGVTFASGQLHEFKPDDCAILKSTGALVGVIYTKYLDDTGNFFFDNDVQPFYGQIEPALRACASTPDLFAKGDSADEIKDAFVAIAESAKKVLALSR